MKVCMSFLFKERNVCAAPKKKKKGLQNSLSVLCQFQSRGYRIPYGNVWESIALRPTMTVYKNCTLISDGLLSTLRAIRKKVYPMPLLQYCIIKTVTIKDCPCAGLPFCRLTIARLKIIQITTLFRPYASRTFKAHGKSFCTDISFFPVIENIFSALQKLARKISSSNGTDCSCSNCFFLFFPEYCS